MYSNLHVLTLGGVPESSDMKTFAPELWLEQTKSPAVYFVWKDCGLSADEYIKQTKRMGYYKIVNERTEAPPDESSSPIDEDAEMECAAHKAELWAAAESKWKLRGKREATQILHTSGLSAQGIVPKFNLEQAKMLFGQALSTIPQLIAAAERLGDVELKKGILMFAEELELSVTSEALSRS